jgi:GNAT superfamily N-acetyltransferase
MEDQGDTVEAITIRPCDSADRDAMLAIINAAAEAYRGVIPDDRWREPYMPADELASEMTDGVMFSGCVARGGLVGVMGAQRRYNVDLIRHAYVLPGWQGRGVGSMLLEHLRSRARGPILIGTWRAADWAIRFYERHGFTRVSDADTAPLLRTYWNVPERQIATSVVLASPALPGEAASRLIADVSRPLPPD